MGVPASLFYDMYISDKEQYMAHFAQIEEGVVTKVIVVDNSHCTNDEGTEVEELGVQYCKSLFGESTEWKQTSYNSSFRGRLATVGGRYDEASDMFISIEPPEGGVLGADGMYGPAVPKPTTSPGEGLAWQYNPSTQEWDTVLDAGPPPE